MTPYRTPDRSVFRAHWALVLAYLLLGISGMFTLFVAPSSSLAQQGGRVIVVAWGAACIVGGLAGMLGLFIRKVLIELIGGGLAAAVSLTWTAALLLQAVTTGSAIPLPGACVAGTLTLLLVQRQVDAHRSQG